MLAVEIVLYLWQVLRLNCSVSLAGSTSQTLTPNYSQRKSNKMQQCIRILFHNYMKLNMFRPTHHPSSGA
jgi:hypothetical protein